jgi:hypothetical protein
LSRARRSPRTLVLCLLALAGAACGGSPTEPSPVNQTINGSVAAFSQTSHTFTAMRAGSMRVTLTWQAAADRDLDLLLTESNCESLFGQPPCPILQESIASAGSSETVTHVVQTGQQVKIWIDSYSVSNHSYSIQIVID